MDARDFEPDADASALDRQVMQMAGQMYAAGWHEEAEEITSNLAYLREYIGNPNDQTGGTLTGLYDALLMVSGCAARITEVLAKVYPDETALRRRDD